MPGVILRSSHGATSAAAAAAAAALALVVMIVHLGAAAAEEVAISAPDIYPLDTEPVIGEVTVKIVAQAREAVVRYTLDGSTPTEKVGLDYAGPVHLFTPGTHVVRAIAISKVPGRADSAVTTRAYVILKSNVAVPFPRPLPSQKFRGTVRVTLASPEEDVTELQYVLDVETPGDRWQPYSGPVIIDSPGEHVLQARAVKRADGKPQYSPAGRFRYVLTPALRYDVMASCKKCDGGEPVVGQWFTIFLQNVEERSELRLTTSQKGCATGLHTLDDTDVVTTRFRQVAYRFRTDTEPKPNVWVCVKEPSNGTWIRVPRNQKVGVQGSGSDAFSIDSAISVVAGRPESALTPQPFVELSGFTTSSGQGSGGVWMLFGLLGFVVGVLLVVSRSLRRVSATTVARRTLGRSHSGDGQDDGDATALRIRQEAV